MIYKPRFYFFCFLFTRNYEKTNKGQCLQWIILRGYDNNILIKWNEIDHLHPPIIIFKYVDKCGTTKPDLVSMDLVVVYCSRKVMTS